MIKPTSQDQFASNVKFVDINSNPNVLTQPLTVKEGNSTLHYKPKTILSRYVVGQPVAFTDQPILPVHYQHSSPPKTNFSQIPVVETTSQHIPYQNLTNLSKSIYKNVENDFVLQSRKRTVSYDNRTSQSPIHQSPIHQSNYQRQSSMSYVRKQTFEKILQQNTQLRNQNSRLMQENRKLKLHSYPDSTNKDAQITQLLKRITQLTQQIQNLKVIKSTEMTKTMSTTTGQISSHAINQLRNEQVQEIFSSCLQKYRTSILEQQKLLIDRYRLECKNQQLDQKKQKLQSSRRQQQYRSKSYSCYQQGDNRIFAQSKENWENLLPPNQGRHRHWRKTKN